jgi:TrmH family RNA methyltransferase
MALSKSTIKFLRSLQLKKYRQKYNKFVVEGEKMVDELLRQSAMRIEALYALEAWIAGNREIASLEGNLYEVTDAELRKISGLKSPNKVLAVVHRQRHPLHAGLIQNDYCLYLDGIRDPGNLGTILRTADWFGLPYVFGSPDCVDLYNPKVIQASMGAFLRVRYLEQALPTLLEQFPGLPVLGAVLDGENVFDAELPGRGILVIGSEAQGISPSLLQFITCRIAVPPAVGGGAQSLNAAVATGIITAVLRNRGGGAG